VYDVEDTLIDTHRGYINRYAYAAKSHVCDRIKTDILTDNF
jgi:hypothetical protein